MKRKTKLRLASLILLLIALIFLFCSVICIISQTSRCCKMEFSDHKIGNHISDHKECYHADYKIDQIPGQSCFYRHGDTGDKFQVTKGMKTQVDNTGHCKCTSLKYCINQI